MQSNDTPETTASETTTITVPSPRRVLKALAIIVPLVLAVAAAAFFVGQGTRKSDERVASEKRAAAR